MFKRKPKKPKSNSLEVMIEILEDIERINLGRFNKNILLINTMY